MTVAPDDGNEVEYQPGACVPHWFAPGADAANWVPAPPLNRTHVGVELKIDEPHVLPPAAVCKRVASVMVVYDEHCEDPAVVVAIVVETKH